MSARFNTLSERTSFSTQFAGCPCYLRRHAFEKFGPAGRRLHCPLTGRILCPHSYQKPLVGIVFYHGLIMQHAVECDERGRSNYAICAVNPSRVGKTFDDAALREIVDAISNDGGRIF